MTLFDDGTRDCPDIEDYSHMGRIPEAERCQNCEGLGTIRWRNSMTGDGDWRVCYECHGSGRKRASKVH